MIRALLVDDEPWASERLRSLLTAFPDVEVVGTSGTVADARNLLEERRPDVVFLDMRMRGETGLDLLPHVPPTTHVVFVTADASFAAPAFDHDVVDFLLKPVSKDRLATAVDKLRRELAQPRAAMPGDQKLAVEGMLTVPRDGSRSVEQVPVSELVWVVANDNYTEAHFRRSRPALQKRTVAEWLEILPEPPFHRAERSLIINMGQLVRLVRLSRNKAVVHFADVEKTLEIGRTATDCVRRLLRS